VFGVFREEVLIHRYFILYHKSEHLLSTVTDGLCWPLSLVSDEKTFMLCVRVY